MFVKTTKNSKYPDGSVHEAWKGLERKYCPVSGPTLAKLNKLFHQAKLKKRGDPDVFITYLEDLRIQIERNGTKISDNEFVLHVLGNLTKEYEVQVNDLEKTLNQGETTMTIENMRDVLNLRFERLQINQDESEDKEEHALVWVPLREGAISVERLATRECIAK